VKTSKLILASSSPQRLSLLKTIGIKPDEVVPANIEEIPLKNEKPKDFVIRMSQEKAFDVAKKKSNCFILSGDTIVAAGRRIIGKPSDRNEAKEILSLLSGRRHRVLSAFTLIKPDLKEITKLVTSKVKFSRLSENADRTLCLLPESKLSISLASFLSDGLPIILLPAATIVSPDSIKQFDFFLATSNAFS
jgi:MAF protein